jgi:hypothetical protein
MIKRIVLVLGLLVLIAGLLIIGGEYFDRGRVRETTSQLIPAYNHLVLVTF